MIKLEEKDINTIREGLALLERWYLFFELPEWTDEQEKEAQVILSVINTLSGYLERNKDETMAYFFDGDAALVHLENPAIWIEEIENALLEGDKNGR